MLKVMRDVGKVQVLASDPEECDLFDKQVFALNLLKLIHNTE